MAQSSTLSDHLNEFQVMLFKSAIIAYAKSLEGTSTIERDPIVFGCDRAKWEPFRKRALEDISDAVVYRLDEGAAYYADTLREELRGWHLGEEMPTAVTRAMEETPLPHDLIWVEHDHAPLVKRRIEGGYGRDDSDIDPNEFGLRGMLIDNRSKEVLKIKVFRTQGPNSNMIIDPMTEGHFEKRDGEGGKFVLSRVKLVYHEHMIEFYKSYGLDQSGFKDIEDEEFADISFEMTLPFMVFAEMNSKDQGLILGNKETLTTSERKKARKFGKAWMTERLRDHVTIRIGEPLQKHLSEKEARLSYERDVASGRTAPVEHWVSEHERHYKSGKVVLVKAHRRGTKPDDKLPRLVKGPRSI